MKWMIAIFVALGAQADFAQNGNAIYDPNPNHLWNRLNEALFARTTPDGGQYGLGEMDILYWYTTTNLLAGTSRQKALSVLDEFINSHGEKLVSDPLKKALLQRDLWALFDWAAEGRNWNHQTARRELLRRLAVVIQRLELTTNEIAALPDNEAMAEKSRLPDLPRGLLQTNGGWINLGVQTADRLVPMHDLGFGGRSVFMVLFHDPGGRAAGTNYLNQLAAVRPMWIPFTNNFPDQMILNRDFPQFPTNSQWALVRRLCVIDTVGNIRPTRVVESIQLRTYLGLGAPKFVTMTNGGGFVVPVPIPPIRFNEFRLTRPDAALRSLAQNEQDFTSNNHFFSRGFDPFQGSKDGKAFDARKYQGAAVLKTCVECHGGAGIYSVNSFTRALSGQRSAVTTELVPSNGKREEEMTVAWKENRAEWGLLQGLWMQPN